MIDMSLSFVAWLAVVLVQAFVHYGIMGKRRRSREKENHADEDGEDTIVRETSTSTSTSMLSVTPVEENSQYTCNDQIVSDENQERRDDTDLSLTGSTLRNAIEHLSAPNKTGSSRYGTQGNEGCPAMEYSGSTSGTVDSEDGWDLRSNQAMDENDWNDANNYGSCSMPSHGSFGSSASGRRYSLDTSDDEDDDQWRYDLLQTYYSSSPCSVLVNNFDLIHAKVPRDYGTIDDSEDENDEDGDNLDKSQRVLKPLNSNSLHPGAPRSYKRMLSDKEVGNHSKSRKVVSFNLGANVATVTSIVSQ